MATRTNDLTEFAKPIADELAARCGSLKRLLSAGVLAFNDLGPMLREYYMARASGKDVDLTAFVQDELALREKLIQAVVSAAKEPPKKKAVRSAKPAKSS